MRIRSGGRQRTVGGEHTLVPYSRLPFDVGIVVGQTCPGQGYLVPVEVRECAKGQGVFATERIVNGTLLWQPHLVRAVPRTEAADMLAGMHRLHIVMLAISMMQHSQCR